ncbi:DUF2487 family protein [Bacillus sp. NPDC077027]|uniref:DUF2487 family protein n=1 Tax=Bacillus sp. NPDC077027 TaxID=3390548 RepID=UPI003D085124
MRWKAEDADAYLQSKDYIDTAIIPLVGINIGGLKQTVSLGEFTVLVTEELERQLRGRVFLFPSYTYLEVNERQQAELYTIKKALSEHFQHVIFVTSDAVWSNQSELSESLYILQPVPLEHLKVSLKQKVVQDSVEKILNFLLQKWSPS